MATSLKWPTLASADCVRSNNKCWTLNPKADRTSRDADEGERNAAHVLRQVYHDGMKAVLAVMWWW